MTDKIAHYLQGKSISAFVCGMVFLSLFLVLIVGVIFTSFFAGGITPSFIIASVLASIVTGIIVCSFIAPIASRLKETGKSSVKEFKKQKELEEKVRLANFSIENASYAVYWMKSDGCFTFANNTASKMLGYSREELMSMSIFNISPNFPKEAWEAHWNDIKIEKHFSFEAEHQTKNGDSIPVEITVNYLEFDGKEYNCAFVQDLIKRKASEQKAEKLEENLLSILERTRDIFYRSDTEGKLAWVSPSVTTILGYLPEEVIGNKMGTFYVNPEMREKFKQELKTKSGFVKDFEAEVKHKNGYSIWVSTNATYFYNDDGTIGGIEGIVRDIHERKEAEEDVRISEEKYRTLIDNMQDGVFLIQGAKFFFINETFAKMVGYKVLELLGETFDKIIAPEDLNLVMSRYTARIRGENILSEYEFSLLHKDGSTRIPVHIMVSLTKYLGRTASIGTIKDITEKRRIESDMLKAQKLESLGILAGGIAHDFNNILTVILGNLSIARTSPNLDGETKEILSDGIQATKRAQDLTKQLLTFSKGGEPVTKVIDLKTLLEESVSFAARGTSSTHKINFVQGLYNVEVDEGQINQVINNLVINADQAMPEGGEISIIGANIKIDAQSKLPLSPGEYAYFMIEDRGIGIQEKYLDKIFDPYFTSKKKGSGLGLATSYSIIKNHHGHIAVESTIGKGARFTVYLPASDKKPEKPAPEVELKTGSGRVLVMDDEKVIRDVVGRMLKKLGYQPSSATDGLEAIELFQKAIDENKRFDAVILDMNIVGGMGGADTVRELKNIDPDIVAVVSSGYSDDATGVNREKNGFDGGIAKPFEMEKLGDLLHSLLVDKSR